jgi:hypothetical protein
MYKHIILLKFSNSLTQSQCFKLLEELGQLQRVIPEILSYQYGLNDPDNPHHQGFRYAFVMTFASKSERQHYQSNFYHQDYINKKFNQYIDNAIIFDMDCE